jgi:hypothetical protein
MTDEYLRAIAIMQAAQLEYMHVIAWANSNGPTNRQTVERTAERVARQIKEQCPNVLQELVKP